MAASAETSILHIVPYGFEVVLKAHRPVGLSYSSRLSNDVGLKSSGDDGWLVIIKL